MRNASVLLLGALCLVACAKERPAASVTSTTTTTGAPAQPVVSVEEVRTVLLEKRPGSAETINALMIRNDGGIVTLRGSVEDEQLHSDIVNRVRAMPNIRGVRDEIQIGPKTALTEHGKYGTTTTTGATTPGEHEHAKGEHEKAEHEKGEHPKGEHEKSPLSKSDAVRKSMEKARAKSEAIIHALTITDDGQVVTLSGVVPDEDTHQALLKAAKDTPGVKSVKDELKVQSPKK